MTKRILVIGPPRSATTWVATILGSASGAELVMEPDNEKTSLLAALLKRGVPRFPMIGPDEEAATGYELLWRLAFCGRYAALFSRSLMTRVLLRWWADDWVEMKKRGGGSCSHLRLQAWLARALVAPWEWGGKQIRVVKSVHALFCLEWLVARFAPDFVVVVKRHPLGILSSWRKLSMPDATRIAPQAALWLKSRGCLFPDRPAAIDEEFHNMLLQVAYMRETLGDILHRHPEFIEVSHESLCEDPKTMFQALFQRCGMPWSDHAEDALQRSNRSGTGYKPAREARREPGKWRSLLTESEMEYAGQVLTCGGEGM